MLIQPANDYPIGFTSPKYELEFRGTNSGTVFIRTRDVQECVQTTSTERVSLMADGSESPEGGAIDYRDRALSDDGRFVLFRRVVSASRFLIRDREQQALEQIDVSDVNGSSAWPGGETLSGDGQVIAFFTQAKLVQSDTNGTNDIYVFDRQTDTFDMVSVGLSGAPANGESLDPTISSDGRYIAFESKATNLIANDSKGNAQWGVYVHDRTSGETKKVSGPMLTGHDLVGIEAWSAQPSISGDGRYVAFVSISNRIVANDTNASADVFVRDMVTGIATRASVGSTGSEGTLGSAEPSISRNGRYVAFESRDTFDPLSPTSSYRQVFVRDLETRTTELASRGLEGGPGNGQSDHASMGSNGTVVFSSVASDLVPNDDSPGGAFAYSAGGEPSMISVGTQGQGTVGGDPPSISGDGHYAAFTSGPGLVCDDSNDQADVFLVPTAGTGGSGQGNFQYVAMGDSYSSGEGVPPYEQGTDSEGVNECHRSESAYPSYVHSPDTLIPYKLRARTEVGVAWDFIACSGATTENVRSGGQFQQGESASQVDQGKLNAATDLVSITIGGNDAGFATVLRYCAAHACLSSTFRPFDDRPFSEWLPDKIDSVEPEVAAALTDVRTAAPNALVAVLGYPHVFPDTELEQSCPQLAVPYGGGEQAFLNDIADQLNGVISSAAASSDSSFVDMVSHFWNHEVCAQGGEWIYGPSAPFDAIDYRGIFHPNLYGQFEYATPLNSFLAGESATASFEATNEPGRADASEELSERETLGSLGSLGIEISPASRCADGTVRDGGRVRIRGTGFAPSEDVHLVLTDGSSQEKRSVEQVKADEGGALNTSIELPVSDQDGEASGNRSVKKRFPHILEAKGDGNDGGGRILVEFLAIVGVCD